MEKKPLGVRLSSRPRPPGNGRVNISVTYSTGKFSYLFLIGFCLEVFSLNIVFFVKKVCVYQLNTSETGNRGIVGQRFNQAWF